MTHLFALLAFLAPFARITSRGAVRIHLGRVRIYADSEEVTVWTVGAPAIAARWVAATATPAVLLPATAAVWPARQHRPVWRTGSRPASLRLAGVA